MRRMHVGELAIYYGMIEAPVSFRTSPGHTIGLRMETVGDVQPNIEVQATSQSSETIVQGTPREIRVRGYNTLLRHWDDRDETALAIAPEDGMRTGNLGTLDSDGFLRIVGQIKEIVICGGENLLPKEIEDFLRSNPDILDTNAFGQSDDTFGERLCAYVSSLWQTSPKTLMRSLLSARAESPGTSPLGTYAS